MSEQAIERRCTEVLEHADVWAKDGTTEPLGFPPAVGAYALFDVEEPLLEADNTERDDGCEEADDGDDEPACVDKYAYKRISRSAG